MVKFHTQFDRPKSPGIKFPKEEGRTKQSEKDACDINAIVAMGLKSGVMPWVNSREPAYGDFSDVPTYLEAYEVVQNAQEQFASLPAQVRARFDNEPRNFLAFASDPGNVAEMVSMGLAVEREGRLDPTPSPASPDPSKGSMGAPKGSPKGDSGDA